MRKYDWERRKKTEMQKAIADFKLVLKNIGMNVNSSDFFIGVRGTISGEGFFKLEEDMRGDIASLDVFKTLLNIRFNELEEKMEDRIEDEVNDRLYDYMSEDDAAALESENYDLLKKVEQLEEEIQRLKESKGV